MKEVESGNGFEVFRNEDYEENGVKGRYTEKRFHLEKNVPAWLRSILTKRYTVLTEKCWNEYPKTTTKYFNEALSRVQFSICSNHIAGLEIAPNALDLSEADLAIRKIISMDLLDFNKCKSYDPELDVTLVHSEKCSLLPLSRDWKSDPSINGIVCYKLIRIDIPAFGLLGSRIENYIIGHLQEKMLAYLSSALCWIDQWYDLSLDTLRTMEEECYELLNQKFREEYGITEEQPADEKKEAENTTTPTETPPPSVVDDMNPQVSTDRPYSPSDEFEDALEEFEDDNESVFSIQSSRAPQIVEISPDNEKASPPTFTGYLFKLASGFFSSTWNVRYIVVSGYNLYYFDSKTDLKPKANISLRDARVEWIGEYMNRAFVFTITTKAKRVSYWSADAEASVKRWILLFQAHAEQKQETLLGNMNSDWFIQPGGGSNDIEPGTPSATRIARDFDPASRE
ncbi:bifunctional PH-like domain superfamily/Pleckstrin homology domain/START-like domain superfamily/Phosphatidylinositol transfer protein [Babesia duncani]|uniref:Bifunctional PH-like domain superfamily/Pleckstrin homology domain/START-like domain superfamily/Phosphatidylinositol transfer protein n=1 Tax=Babesia duncani TaxID=323732 RepID=A0AAD9PI23_9APIC|nr:bifunctional PH-like domain superfamily/Pleckstrin homology domain/START-like domain superfamily/Phosphatidylinositol transfer protein [Babesia duncani]KAK2197881.1 bifunctional PH-like domain superfamily/Pleckstrin homology domain/START-like domain superfamily/Phosphatidylinositol transfer protein [Babesia duncani]